MDFKNSDLLLVNQIAQDFEKFKRDLIDVDYVHNKDDFFDLMKNFRKYLVTIDVGNNFETFYHSEVYSSYKKFFTEINEYYVRSVESMQALSVMTKGVHNFNSITDFLDTEYMKESFERKSEELSPLDFSSAKKMVLAGCGPFAETLIYIYENTDIDEIIGLDYNHEAIYMAGEMMNGLKFENIGLKQVDASEYDYSDIDIVSIPIFIPKKESVINQIIKTGKKDIQILVTNPKGFLSMVYEPMGNISPRGKIVYREDFSSNFIVQEIIKIEKYNF